MCYKKQNLKKISLRLVYTYTVQPCKAGNIGIKVKLVSIIILNEKPKLVPPELSGVFYNDL